MKITLLNENFANTSTKYLIMQLLNTNHCIPEKLGSNRLPKKLSQSVPYTPLLRTQTITGGQNTAKITLGFLQPLVIPE